MKAFHATLFIACSLVAQVAWADHRHRSHFGVYVGTPWIYPPPYAYYPPPYAYYPPRVVVLPASPPPVYVEQTPVVAPAPAANWYYCEPSRGYYPYVRECPTGWVAVAPTPTR